MNKLVYLILVLSIFISCGPKQEQEKIEMVFEDGVEVVINHLEPYTIKGEATSLTLEKEFSIDTESDKMAELGLVGMSDFNIDSYGNIYIMLRQTSGNFIFKFDNKGNFITSFCRHVYRELPCPR